jgi:translin
MERASASRVAKNSSNGQTLPYLQDTIKYSIAHILNRIMGRTAVERLKTVLNRVRVELKKKDKIRETTQKQIRKAISLSKQSILLVHQKRLNEAEKLLKKASETLLELDETSKTSPDIVYSGLYSAALQEHSEANIFLNLVEESRFVTPQEIKVPLPDYVLGLADVIGECRRTALDALREGDTKKAEKWLQTMDEIYMQLMAMDESYMLVPGLRRKCDVARKIIEITRGDITQEVRRNTLEKHLRRFEKQARRT